MVIDAKRIGALVLRLIVGLALLGCPRISSAARTWSVSSCPQKPGDLGAPVSVAGDPAGNLYVADITGKEGRIQKRDVRGNWFTLATGGDARGQIHWIATLAVDAAGNLYVADGSYEMPRIRKRDARGNWSVLATKGVAPGEVSLPCALALDPAGNLYVAECTAEGGRIQRRDSDGH